MRCVSLSPVVELKPPQEFPELKPAVVDLNELNFPNCLSLGNMESDGLGSRRLKGFLKKQRWRVDLETSGKCIAEIVLAISSELMLGYIRNVSKNLGK